MGLKANMAADSPAADHGRDVIGVNGEGDGDVAMQMSEKRQQRQEHREEHQPHHFQQHQDQHQEQHQEQVLHYHPNQRQQLHEQQQQQQLQQQQQQLQQQQQQQQLQLQQRQLQHQHQQHEHQHQTTPPTIRILTHNVWGLKYISHAPLNRLTEIAHQILSATHPPHIVALQELFTYSAYLQLRRLTHSLLPHGRFFHSSAFGSGLVILSRWRIVESRMVPYRLNGRPSAFWRGDWYVGKGVGWVKVVMGREFWERGGKRRYLEVFNTHLHAPYNEGTVGKDTYACHRASQAWEIGDMMRAAVERGSVVVGAGDFNMVVGGLEWAVLQARTGGLLRDVWRELHPDSSVGAWIDRCEKERLKKEMEMGMVEGAEGGDVGGPPTVQQSLALHGHTCDSVLNTWRWSKSQQKDLLKGGVDRVIGPDELDPRAKRLDYIFLGDGAGEWRVQDASVVLTQRHPELKCSLSDHFAVEATIVRARPGSGPGPSGEGGEMAGQHLHARQVPSASSLRPVLLQLLVAYTARARLHRRRRLLHFVACIPVTLACWVAIWFSPRHYVSFLLMLVSSLGLLAGCVDGLIGGLFGGWELRGLKEWERAVREWGLIGEGEEDEERKGVEWDEEEEEEEERGRVRDWWD